MSRAVLMPRTAAGFLQYAVIGGLIVIVIILAFNGMYQSSANTSAVSGSDEGFQNIILGLAILAIAGTFRLIAYYYRTIDFGSRR